MLHHINLPDLKTAMLLTLMPVWPVISWLYVNGFLPEHTSVLTVLVVVTLDTIFGVLASRKAGGKVSSLRLRKMGGKVLQYMVVIVLFLLVCKTIPNETVRTWVMAFPYTLICLFEGISVVENMLIIWPKSRVLRGISSLLNLKVRDLLDDGQLNGSAGTITDKHDA